MVRIERFKLKEGDLLADKYEILSHIGKGWEGEVYLVKERGTGIHHAAKLFYPQRDKQGKATRFTARKLHKLRHCPILTHYHHQETVEYDDIDVRMLVSEFVEGHILKRFLRDQTSRRLTPFEGVHLLRALAKGLAPVHAAREYHGDIHEENIIVRRRGVSFELKLVDVHNLGPANAELIAEDVIDMVRVFYDSIGGQKKYASQPWWVKEICCGLRRGLITHKYKNANQLLSYLDNFSWD